MKSEANVQAIALYGFDHRVTRRGLYGDDTYFASQACKSHQYTCGKKGHANGCRCAVTRTVILARVALGDPFLTRATMPEARRPPKRHSSGALYDSVLVNPGFIASHPNGNQGHQEFVTFDTAQAYPCYVIEYTV